MPIKYQPLPSHRLSKDPKNMATVRKLWRRAPVLLIDVYWCILIDDFPTYSPMLLLIFPWHSRSIDRQKTLHWEVAEELQLHELRSHRGRYHVQPTSAAHGAMGDGSCVFLGEWCKTMKIRTWNWAWLKKTFFFESHFQVRDWKEFVPWQSDLQHLATVEIPLSEHQSNQFVSQFLGGFPSRTPMESHWGDHPSIGSTHDFTICIQTSLSRSF